MDFSYALRLLKTGRKLTREKWEDDKAVVILKEDGGIYGSNQQFWKSLNKKTAHHDRTNLPYTITLSDILAMDWIVIP